MEQPDLQTPGGMISNQRKQRGMSLSDLSKRTKIPVPVLVAIESNEFHRVSGALYIKSFLRTCASELGLVEDDIMASYSQFSGEAGAGGVGGAAGWREEEVKISRIGVPWRMVGMSVAALVLVGLIVVLSLRGCGSEEAPTTTTVAEPEATVPSLADSLSRSFSGSLAQPIVTPSEQPELQLPPTQPETLNAELPLPRPSRAGFEFAGDEERVVVLRIVCATGVQIEIKRDGDRTFEQAIWPAVEDLGQPLPDREVVAGQVYRVQGGYVVYWGARDHFDLKLAASAGVEVTLNGVNREVGSLQPGGEMVLDIHGR